MKNNLDKNRVKFLYPDELKEQIDLEKWSSTYGEIDNLNKDILLKIHNNAGVYAIYVGNQNEEESEMMYIGQTNSNGAKSRIRSHLVWRNKNTKSGKYTGSKFDEVFKCVTSGKVIYLSFCQISPASLRHYVEENLFSYVKNGWNQHGA